MNERIEELIVSYLHRGCTPDEEKELFDACRMDSNVANLLREHLILSLKLRQLRDQTEVPVELHNAIIRRINEASPTLPKEESVQNGIVSSKRRFRFSWAHLAGTAIAGATASFVLFFTFFTGPSEAPIEPLSVVHTVHDTVYRVKTETVTQVKYIRRSEQAESYGKQDKERLLTDVTREVKDDTRKQIEEFITELHEETDKSKAILPLPIDSLSITVTKKSEQPSYLEQYAAMLVSLEKIKLTDNDRIRN